MELLWQSFFPKTSIYFFKVYYYYTGCPKKRKIPYNGLKIEIYEFNQFSCSPEKVFPYELELLWSILSPIHVHIYSKCILTIQGVPKKKYAKKWASVGRAPRIWLTFKPDRTRQAVSGSAWQLFRCKANCSAQLLTGFSS